MGRRTVPCKLCHGETRDGRFLPTDEVRDVCAVSIGESTDTNVLLLSSTPFEGVDSHTYCTVSGYHGSSQKGSKRMQEGGDGVCGW